MPMNVWQHNLVDEAGNVLPSSSIEVRDQVTSNLIQLYSDYAGASAIGNPITADADGFVRFYADAGRYRITATLGAFTRIWEDVLLGTVDTLIKYVRTAEESAASVTPVNYQYAEGHVYRYGTNTAPGTTNMATAINNAILAMAQHDEGGIVQFPADNCRITSTINAANNVTLQGHGGQASTITADNCDGITLNFESYYGRTIIRDLYILGVNSTTRTGIKAPGTLFETDQVYGVTVERCFIRTFNVGIHFRTAWQNTIHDNRIEDVERGIELIGGNIGSHIDKNWIIRSAGGGGSGAITGIVINSFNYTSGAGVVPPEGVLITQNLIYGFETGISIPAANFVNVLNNDFYTTVYGVSFVSVSLNFNIVDNYFQLGGAGIVAGIAGAALAAPLAIAKVSIERNSFNAASGVSAVGVQMNDNSNGGQDYVSIIDNFFTGFNAADIRVYNAGQTWIQGNRCASSAPTNSIHLVNSVLSGQVHINENLCTKAISFTAADQASGKVVVGANIHSGSTQLNIPGKWTTPSFSAGNFTGNGSMTWTVAAGDVTTYAYEIVGNKMTVLISLDTTTVGGTPSTALLIAIPASKVAAKETYTTVMVLDNSVRTIGTAHVIAGGTTILIQRSDAANWAAATDTTYVKGQISFEIQ